MSDDAEMPLVFLQAQQIWKVLPIFVINNDEYLKNMMDFFLAIEDFSLPYPLLLALKDGLEKVPSCSQYWIWGYSHIM